MKFRIKPNVLPKNIRLFQKYMEESDDESSSYYSEDSSEEYTTSAGSDDGSSNSESCDESEYSYESDSTTTRNFSEFLEEYNEKRN